MKATCITPGCERKTFREYFAHCEAHLEPFFAQFARRRAIEDRRELPRFDEIPRRVTELKGF